MTSDTFHVYDTTLRDGSQREGLSLSVEDKLAVAAHLDDLGVGFIEGGWPGANPKDAAFFRRAAAGELPLRHAQLAAFGATRKPSLAVRDDPQVQALLDAATPVVTLVAKSLAAVDAGATHVQGTANGYGERAGNADLLAVVAALEVKLGHQVLPEGTLADLVRVSHAIAEVANIAPDDHQPWVGASAFAHKAGLHASALKVDPDLYQHTDPALVGNDMRVLVSELAGRASIELKARELDIAVDRETVGRVIEWVKAMEAAGYSFEAAEASFELLLREEVEGQRTRFFELESYRVISEHPARGRASGAHMDSGAHVSEATVKLHAKGERFVATGEGNGPVNALDRALRQALERLHPQLASFELVDYKVRILEGAHGTGAVTRVLVRTSDGAREWDTVGVDENVISASWQALDDAYTFGLLHTGLT